MIRVLVVMMALLLLTVKQGFAIEHVQKDGLFSMDIPQAWHWDEFPGEVVIAFADGKTAAMDIQMTPIEHLSSVDIRQRLKDNDDFLVKQIQAHGGSLTSQQMIKIDGVDASDLNFKTSQGQDIIAVTYISFFNKGQGFRITYATKDVKTHEVLDDVMGSLKF